MALLVCAACSTRFAVGLAACPHCLSRDCHEEGTTPMPKIGLHLGATHASNIPDAPTPATPDAPAPAEADPPAPASPAPTSPAPAVRTTRRRTPPPTE